MKGVCSEGECGGLLMNAEFCDDMDGDDDGAGELSVDGDSDEHGDELSGLDTGGIPPRNRDMDESGNTSGLGLGLAFGRVKRPIDASTDGSCTKSKSRTIVICQSYSSVPDQQSPTVSCVLIREVLLHIASNDETVHFPKTGSKLESLWSTGPIQNAAPGRKGEKTTRFTW